MELYLYFIGTYAGYGYDPSVLSQSVKETPRQPIKAPHLCGIMATFHSLVLLFSQYIFSIISGKGYNIFICICFDYLCGFSRRKKRIQLFAASRQPFVIVKA